MEDPPFASFELDSLNAQMLSSGERWLPFFKGKNLLTGLYKLPAGSTDHQQPHDTDEVYYVVSGKSKFTAGNHTVDVNPGSILFVKAEEIHSFFEIEEDLIIVVFFDQKKFNLLSEVEK